MTIGIIAAMDEEIVYLKNKLTITNETKIAQSLFIEGELADRKVVLLKSGIGKVNAAMSTTILHEKFKPNLVEIGRASCRERIRKSVDVAVVPRDSEGTIERPSH